MTAAKRAAEWPVPPDVREPAPPERRRAWGKVSHEERYRAQRRDLLRAAARLGGRLGYDGTRVADIVAEAGLSKSTFYEHFSSKEDCFVELHRRTSAHMLQAGIDAAEATADDPPYERILAVCRALVGYVERDPRLAAVMRTELGAAQPAIREHREENRERIVELFVVLAERCGTDLSTDDLGIASRVLVLGVTEMLPDVERDPDDLDETLRAVARVACRAFGFPLPRERG